MPNALSTHSKSDSIRDYVRRTYVEPARSRGEQRIKVVAGEVHTAVGLRNRIPLVCSALRSRSLLARAGLRIISDEGPPSGLSSTVAITYEILPREAEPRERREPDSPSSRLELFRRLRGVARKTFESLGGGEKFIRGERQRFFGKEAE